MAIAVAVHAAAFSAAAFDDVRPFVEKPKATRVFIVLPSPELALEPAAEVAPEVLPVADMLEAESPVEIPEQPVEPEPEPAPEPESAPEPPLAPEPAVESPPLADPLASEAAEDSDGLFDEPPQPRHGIKPKYPLLARREKWEGDVVCEASVTRHGRVDGASVVKSSGFEVLDAAALRAVRLSRFRPALRRGRAVDASVRLTIEFRIDDG